MRKLKLLMMMVCVLMGVSQTWAQIDVTSKYLTNPSFESGDMTGWSVATKTNGSEQAITVGAYGSTSEDFGVFSDRGGTAASGSYVMKFSQWWSQYAAIYQTSPVTLPAGTYRLTANLQNHEKREGGHGNYTLGYIAGSVTTTEAPLTFTEYVNGTFAEALQGTVVAKEFTLATDTEVTFAAQSEVWGWHIFQADDFKLYRLTDVTNTYIANADFNTTPINVAGKTADVGTKGTGSGQENVSYTPTSWTQKTYNDNCLGATVPYGFSHKMNGATVPSRDHSNGEEGAFLFLSVGWGGTIEFTTNEVTLSPGIYTLSYYAYNANTNTGMKSRVGFIPTSGSETISSKNSFAASQWVQDQVTLTITENTAGKFCIGASTSGAASGSKGSGNYAKIFIDGISLEYMPFAEAADYTELSTAISTVEAYTLGFDAGEYASYNVLPILNAAKAIDQGANNSLATVRELIDALNAITPNATEVNAIYDGNFDDAKDNVATNTIPKGWHGSDSHYSEGYWTRYMYSNGSSNAGLLHFRNGSAMMSKTTPRYGLDDGYTMPLKADTYYKLSFDYAGWNSKLVTTVIITDGSDATVTITPSATETSANAGQTNTGDWKSYSGVFKTNSAGNYKIKFDKREHDGNDGQVAYGAISLVRATASEIKPLLLAEITAANAIYNSGANVGTGVFQVPTAAGDVFNTAINTTAQGVYDNASATVAEVTTAIDNLKAAEETYANATVNGPASGVQYRIKSTAAVGAAWKDLYYVLKKDAGQANGGYSTRAEKDDAAFWATAWKFTSVSGNTYKLSMIDADGDERYLCTNITGYGEGTATQIRTTTDDSKALVVKIIAATGTDGRWFLQNTEDNSYIGGQDAGLFSNSQNYDLAIEAAEKASVNVSIDEAVKYGTRIFPFAPTLPSGVTAYSCTAASESTLMLVEVAEPQANIPYILEALKGCASTNLEGWGTASTDAYTTGWLTGVYTSRDATDGTYVLQNNGGKVGFYKVDTSDVIPTVGAYRCYLSVPSGVRPAFFFGDETTGIDAINGLTSGSATIYSVDGRHLPSLQKGLNIVKTNGKTYKVMVK